MTTQPRRRTLIGAYVCLAIAGVCSLIWPASSVDDSAGRAWATLWAMLLVVGGVSSALGAYRDVWLWEYAGLLPLIAVWLVYGIAAAVTVPMGGSLDRLAPAFALTAVALLLMTRWANVASIRRMAARNASDTK